MSRAGSVVLAFAFAALSGDLRAASFSEARVAFLEKHCTACHGAEKRKGDLALHEFRDDLSLLRERKQWRELIELVESGEMPPEDKPQPTADERKAFLTSVRAVFAKAENAKPDPGRTVLRRLNRAEYNNTVRDLLGISFRPADNFPSDEIGHGFDNMADVLTVSPMLMERYLDAAEQIAAEAVPLDFPKPPKRTMAGRFLEPAGPHVPDTRFRRACGSERDAIHSGPLNTPIKAAPDGEHLFRTRLYASGSAGRPVRVALLVSGPKIADPSPAAEIAQLDGIAARQLTSCRILRIVEISATDEAHAQTIAVKVPPIAGIERMAIAALKPPAGALAPALHVEYLEWEGPLDTRPAASKTLLTFAAGAEPRDRTRAVLERLAPRAWRRPLTQEEMDRLCRIVEVAMASGERWELGLRRAITVILASPKFLFRFEPDGQPQNAEAHPISELHLATRLSYFLWSSCPDDELLGLAGRGQLSANLDGQVRRMLRDPRATALVDNFARQWLQLGRLAGHSADAATFTRWDAELRSSMLGETRRFVAELIRDDHSVLALLDADFTWLDRRLAELYGIRPASPFQGDEWRRVSLAGTARGGLLTQASVLTVTSNPTRTSPVKRGKWVLEQLLGSPPPPPPADIPSLDDSGRKALTGSFRQRLEQHRADPQCAGCHAKMDAFGFALENFNGIGQWRTQDETGAPIATGGELTRGQKLEGLSDLKKLLNSRKDDFARCLTEKMLTYALGRGLDFHDDRTVDRIQAALARDGFRFSTLIGGIVQSEPFRLRRGSAQSGPVASLPK